jgi:hypothetical protein
LGSWRQVRHEKPQGRAYLFGTNGALFATFTIHAEATVAGISSIGADQCSSRITATTRATDAGAMYLFSTNGLLLRFCPAGRR